MKWNKFMFLHKRREYSWFCSSKCIAWSSSWDAQCKWSFSAKSRRVSTCLCRNAFYVLPPPNRAFACCVVGMSLQEGSGWKGSVCQRAGYREAHGPSSRADNWRVSVYLTCQPARQLHWFAALQGSRVLSPAQRAGSENRTWGWPRVLRCASCAAGPSPASQNWDLGGKAYTKEVGGFTGGFAFMNPSLFLPRIDLFVQAWLPPATHY